MLATRIDAQERVVCVEAARAMETGAAPLAAARIQGELSGGAPVHAEKEFCVGWPHKGVTATGSRLGRWRFAHCRPAVGDVAAGLHARWRSPESLPRSHVGVALGGQSGTFVLSLLHSAGVLPFGDSRRV